MQKYSKISNTHLFFSYDDIRHIREHFPDLDGLTNEIIRLYDILSNYDLVECLIEDNG